ncbi:hypothetical protein IJT17_05955 [bacterium]|nr:hypothetical protein [bacterium]
MQEPSLADIIAESFWNGWIPTDLPKEYMKAIELSSMGEKAIGEIRDLTSSWPQLYLSGRQQGSVYQVEGLRACIEQAYEQAMSVEVPQHEATAYLLMALQEGLKALASSCTAIMTGMQGNDWAIMQRGLHCAEQAAKTLQTVYDSTHYGGAAE